MLNWFHIGGFIMYPLLACSLAVWVVLFERLYRFFKLRDRLHQFQYEAVNALLRKDLSQVRSLCARNEDLPTSKCLVTALDRLEAKDNETRSQWPSAVERTRQLVNADLRKRLWVLGTIGSSAPFIGLFGTVVGILRSFNEMARAGAGGFAVVAGGISEALIATAAGLVIAIVAVLAYNAFQVQASDLIMRVKLYVEELSELLGHGA